MGHDNHPKNRWKRQLERKEGSKTEPNYFKGIMQYYRVPTATYCILPSQIGTAPIQVVEFARDLFLNGDPRQRIKKCAFERVYALFDRDDHLSYSRALELARRLDGKLINDRNEKVQFQSIVSIPSFELWFLLHFKLVHGPISRREVLRQLKEHLPNYKKGTTGYFERTQTNLKAALDNSKKLARLTDPFNGSMPYTDVGKLVEFLIKIRE